MLVFALVAVFIAGLMVGRTPEYLGKKIGAFEMKMASLVILLPCAMVLVGTAVGRASPRGRQAGVLNPGPHGFSEILYAFSSACEQQRPRLRRAECEHAVLQRHARSGDARRPVRGDAPGPGHRRVAGPQEARPGRAGTLPTHTPLFVFLLVAVVVVVGALSFLPALALGPIVEHLMIRS